MTTMTLPLPPAAAPPWRYPTAVVLHGGGRRPGRTGSRMPAGPSSPRRPRPLPDVVFRLFFTALLAGVVLAALALVFGDLAVAWQAVKVWITLGSLGVVPSAVWINRHETHHVPAEGGTAVSPLPPYPVRSAGGGR